MDNQNSIQAIVDDFSSAWPSGRKDFRTDGDESRRAYAKAALSEAMGHDENSDVNLHIERGLSRSSSTEESATRSRFLPTVDSVLHVPTESHFRCVFTPTLRIHRGLSSSTTQVCFDLRNEARDRANSPIGRMSNQCWE